MAEITKHDAKANIENTDGFDDFDFSIDINKLDPKKDSEYLNRKMNKAYSLAKELHEKKKVRWSDNFKLFEGKHQELSVFGGKKPDKYHSDTTLNIVFPGVRTLVALLTDAKPQPTVWPAPSHDEAQFEINQKHAEELKEMVDQRWNELAMGLQVPKLLYQGIIFADSFIKYYWDLDADDIGIEVVKPQNLMIYPDVEIDDADFVIETSNHTFTWLKKNYPDALERLKKKMVGKSKADFKIEHFWTDEVMIVRTEKVILDAKQNPFFEFRGEQEQQSSNGQGNPGRIIKNYFNKPRIPYIAFNTYKTDNSTYSTDFMEQIEKIQISFNQRKRQIDDNANDCANSTMLYDSKILPQAQAELHSGRPGEKIGIPGLAQNKDALRFESGKPLDSFVINDMMHSQKVFDDIFGQHDVTRGAQMKTKTLGEAQLLREADQTVVRLLSRNLDVALGKLIEGWVQLMRLFYESPKYVRRLGSDYQEFSRHEIDDGLRIEIKVGSTLPTDQDTRRKDAQMGASLQMISPLDFYKIFKFPEPERMYENLMKWLGKPIPPKNPMDENKLFLAGERQDVSPADNHQQHIQIHQQLADTTPDLTPDIIDAIKTHIFDHDAMEQAKQQQMMADLGRQQVAGANPNGKPPASTGTPPVGLG